MQIYMLRYAEYDSSQSHIIIETEFAQTYRQAHPSQSIVIGLS